MSGDSVRAFKTRQADVLIRARSVQAGPQRKEHRADRLLPNRRSDRACRRMRTGLEQRR